jgi:glycosyltransferase involved in cell wall biosynthesis
MRIAFFGVGYFPHKTAGEKNFYLQLAPLLKTLFEEIIIISVNDQTEDCFIQETDAGSIKIYNFKRPLHFGDLSRFYGVTNGVYHYHHRHGPIQELTEKFLTIALHPFRIRKIIKQHKIDLIYFMDNFGFGMKLMKIITGKKISFAAANYEPRSVIYDKMQSCFLKNLDAVVTYSDAYKKILSGLKIAPDKIHTIHWGVDTNKFKFVSDEDRGILRSNHNLKKEKFIILWTGYIQQIQEHDYYKTISCAKKIIQRNPDIEFIFCFKPETYKEKYSKEASQQLTVLKGHENFGEILSSVDLLLSPIHKLNSTVSPPLTWLEAMSRGVPVLTTNALGVNEVIENNTNGFITNNYDTLVSDIQRIKELGVSKEIRIAARNKICENYNIHSIANRYHKIFIEKT